MARPRPAPGQVRQILRLPQVNISPLERCFQLNGLCSSHAWVRLSHLSRDAVLGRVPLQHVGLQRLHVTADRRRLILQALLRLQSVDSSIEPGAALSAACRLR